MKNNRSLLFLSLAALSLTGCQTTADSAQKSRQTASQDAPIKPASATVSAKRGEFYFPIPNITRQWEWQAAPAMELEYEWGVTLRLKDETFQVGFSRFCLERKGKTVGTFEELIASGQVSIWALNPNGGASTLTGVTAKRQGDGLLIELTEPTLLAKLLAQRPVTLGFESVYGMYSLVPHHEEVTVSYQ